MLKQDTECHIVNTSSLAGLIPSTAKMAAYNVSKNGVVAFSEALKADLMGIKAKINIPVLCPGFVNTRIVDC